MSGAPTPPPADVSTDDSTDTCDHEVILNGACLACGVVVPPARPQAAAWVPLDDLRRPKSR